MGCEISFEEHRQSDLKRCSFRRRFPLASKLCPVGGGRIDEGQLVHVQYIQTQGGVFSPKALHVPRSVLANTEEGLGVCPGFQWDNWEHHTAILLWDPTYHSILAHPYPSPIFLPFPLPTALESG